MPWGSLLAWVSGKVDQELRLKVEYLAAENRILRSQISSRPRLTDGQRITLATISQKLGAKALRDIASVVTPETILRWHRQLVCKKFNTSDGRKAKSVGRPPMDGAVVEQVVAFAGENPNWGYRRIAGALAALEISLSHQTVTNILEDHGIDPAPTRKAKTNWADFIISFDPIPIASLPQTSSPPRSGPPLGWLPITSCSSFTLAGVRFTSAVLPRTPPIAGCAKPPAI
jgi:hypothetical protein